MKGFSNPALLMSCPQGPFGSWKFDFLIFSSPLFRVSCPQGPFGGWKFDFFNFSSPLSGFRARRGLLGAGNLTNRFSRRWLGCLWKLQGACQGGRNGDHPPCAVRSGGSREEDKRRRARISDAWLSPRGRRIHGSLIQCNRRTYQ